MNAYSAILLSGSVTIVECLFHNICFSVRASQKHACILYHIQFCFMVFISNFQFVPFHLENILWYLRYIERCNRGCFIKKTQLLRQLLGDRLLVINLFFNILLFSRHSVYVLFFGLRFWLATFPEYVRSALYYMMLACVPSVVCLPVA